MSEPDLWMIPAGATDWECGWDADALFHLRFFRALSLPDKIRAIEEMEEVAAFFADARTRRARHGHPAGGRGGQGGSESVT